MPEPDPRKIQSFETPKHLAQWLKAHHAEQDELWIRIFKKGSGIPSVNWGDVVIETLCWGWIDGVKKSVDDQVYLQRITPRKAGSSWSKRNKEHAERLIAEGRVQKAGLVQIDAAKVDGRWENAYPPPSETEVPDDFLVALEGNPKAKAFFETLNKSTRYVISHGLMTAKKEETRQRRFEKFLGLLEREEKPSFGFKKK